MSVFKHAYEQHITDKYNEIFSEKVDTTALLMQNYYMSTVNTFTWDKLPEYIPQYLIEECLFFWGTVAAFRDENDNNKLKIFPCFMGGEYLENGLYSHYNIVAKNGKTWIKKLEEIELCFNNSPRVPSFPIVREYCERSAYALSAVNAALERAMLPDIIECADEQQMSAITQMLSKDKNLIPFKVALNSTFKNGEIKRHNTFDNREDDVLALFDIYNRMNNMFNIFNGFATVEINKQERLTEKESSANEEVTRYQGLQDKYWCRNDFCERVKAHFGEDIGFSLNRDFRTVWAIKASNDDKKELFELGNISTTKSEEASEETETIEEVAEDASAD